MGCRGFLWCVWGAILLTAVGCRDQRSSAPEAQYGKAAPAREDPEVRPVAKPYSADSHFKRLDRDDDGALSLEEFLADRKGTDAVKKGTDVFAILDRDHDGKLTLTEFTNRSDQARFRELDDGDGGLDFAEFWRGTISWASQRHAERLFQVLDKDHDGKISPAELNGRPAEGWFLPMDRNEDGFLSYEEFGQGHPNLVKNKQCQAACEFMDTNHDGKLSLEEVAIGLASPEVTFYKRDVDGDGKLTLLEFNAGRAPETLDAAKKEFLDKDIDGDNRLTLVEFKTPREQARFLKLDADHDGFLTVEEFSAGATGTEAARAKNLFLAKDRNGDKKLDPAEFAASSSVVEFLRHDLDGDGLLDFKEFWKGTLSWASEQHATKLFQVRDKDHDGKISPSEMYDWNYEGWFLTVDRNEDGSLSYEEFGQSHTNFVKNRQCQPACEFMDTNHDGKLSFEEVRVGLGSPEINFYKKDVDGDGKVTVEEFSAGIKTAEALASAKRQFQDKDLDGDGRLTMEEFKRSDEDARFAKLDKDRDGFLSLEESLAGTSGKEATLMKKLFLAKDSNGDKKLDRTEYASRSAKVGFLERDLDGDDHLSLAEYLGDRKDSDIMRLETDVFAILDANRDGKLSFTELQAYRPEANFRRLDRAGKGSLDFEAYRNGEMKSASEKHAKLVFASLDRDHDGKLTQEECCRRSSECWFCLLDTNDDGCLTLEEYGKGTPQLVRNKHLARAFRAMDRNGDGKVTVEEYRQPQSEVDFLKRDENGDGVLSWEEFASTASNPQALAAAKKEFTAKDIDGDGRLTLEELKRNPEEIRFATLDKNRDGFLSLEEFSAGATGTEAARAKNLFLSKDRNGDKKLDFAEFGSRSAMVEFCERDLDGDGFWSLAEVIGDRKEPQMVRMATDVFAILDANHDGKLSYAELHAYRPQATFRKLDREGKGSLTFEEYRNGDMKDASEKHAKRVFDSQDRNHDGKLTLEEYCQRSAEAWVCVMDANDDGYLSLEEYGNANQHLVRSKHLERAFRVLDRNGDGKVDAAEYGQSQEEVEFLKRDAQGKGALTFEQYASSASSPEALAAAKKEFARRDSDGNGLLSFKEFVYRAEDGDFWEMDKKGDYCVTKDEFVAFAVGQKGFSSQTAGETKEARAAKLFALLDRNHDNVLMWDEFRTQPATIRFQRMDLNGDSLLSLEEYLPNGATPQEREKAEREFKAKDKNGDSKLTLAEYVGKK